MAGQEWAAAEWEEEAGGGNRQDSVTVALASGPVHSQGQAFQHGGCPTPFPDQAQGYAEVGHSHSTLLRN
jgi:hypothetical protein